LWTPFNLDLQSGEWGSFRSFLCFRLGIRRCQAFNEYSLFLFPSRDTGRRIARIWCSFAHLMLARTFASALIPCGIAAFFSCFPFIPAQTLELSDTTARLCPCCGSMMLPVESILGKLPVVPIGDTGTIPYSMRHHAADFVDAAFDTREGAGDGSRWWYINTWALSWSRERGEK